mmetsp:Transcript_406/g.1196  ORF Transcript_406/g.1196 Transcript_406/m.1196 type:complete len:269 (-) Transcript_406:303-1109(-)
MQEMRLSSIRSRTTLSLDAHADTNERSSAYVMSFKAAVSFATSATCVTPFIDARYRAKSTIPIVSAPALSQKINTRFHGFGPLSRSAMASKSSNFHPRAGRITFSCALAKVANNCVASKLNLFDSSSGNSHAFCSSSQNATFCTAAAAPASNKFPANAASITNANFARASPAASMARHISGYNARHISFSFDFNPKNISSSPFARSSRSFCSTISIKVSPSPLVLAAPRSLSVARAKYSSYARSNASYCVMYALVALRCARVRSALAR